MNIEQPKVLPIRNIVDENSYMRTFYFDRIWDASPGQFVMVWIPGINMKPFSISYIDKTSFAITVCKVGPFTRQLFEKQINDSIGIQGPYGTPFTIQGNSIALVGAGYGIALLSFLADILQQQGKKFIFIAGVGRTYLDVCKNRHTITYCLGTHGKANSASDQLRSIIDTVDMVYTAGPETMMKEITAICNTAQRAYEVFIERYIKCAIGVCGHCSIAPTGKRVCSDGPVFNNKEVSQIHEFGNYKKTARNV